MPFSHKSTPVAILSAMAEEIAPFESFFIKQKIPHKIESRSGSKLIFGTLGQTPVIVAQCGVGKVHAATATQLLIDRYDAQAILFSGVAGALNPTYDIGDLIIATSSMQHDMDCTPMGFERGHIPYSPFKTFEADSRIIDLAHQAAQTLGYKTHLGKILSGDQFIAHPDTVAFLRNDLLGDAVEMEAGALAQVCALNGNIPHLILRAISDKADHSSPVDFPEFCASVSHRCFELVKRIFNETR
jgi:adenosylhomocysteine nucleosidase